MRERYRSHRKSTIDSAPVAVLDTRIARAKKENDLISLILKLLTTAIVVYLLFGVIFGIAVVKGDSMFPNLRSGDLVLFNRLDRDYNRGDIVVFVRDGSEENTGATSSVLAEDGKELVKRVISLPGDTIEIDTKEGILFVNNLPQDDEQIFYETSLRDQDETQFPLVVQDKQLFVLGDNRIESKDSRTFGTISEERVLGVVFWHSGFFRNTTA